LGKLIEWKLPIRYRNASTVISPNTPHSLGELIEWKLIIVGDFRADSVGVVYKTLHSLGKLIEWKPLSKLDNIGFSTQPPYSLGKLIEWKPYKIPACFVASGGAVVCSPLVGETN